MYPPIAGNRHSPYITVYRHVAEGYRLARMDEPLILDPNPDMIPSFVLIFSARTGDNILGRTPETEKEFNDYVLETLGPRPLAVTPIDHSVIDFSQVPPTPPSRSSKTYRADGFLRKRKKSKRKV